MPASHSIWVLKVSLFKVYCPFLLKRIFKKDINLLTGREIASKQSYIVFLNGLVLGIVHNPDIFVRKYGPFFSTSEISLLLS